MNKVRVPSITKLGRPDEYLVNMRKDPRNFLPLGIRDHPSFRPGPKRGYNKQLYEKGYYRFPHSPLDQDPLLVLRRAVKEFITDPSVSDSKTLAIEYIPKIVKTMEDPSSTRRTVYISKRAGRKIFKNTVGASPLVDRINPFNGIGTSVTVFNRDSNYTTSCRNNVCPYCDIPLTEDSPVSGYGWFDNKIHKPFKCNHCYHRPCTFEQLTPSCVLCGALQRFYNTGSAKYLLNLNDKRENLIQNNIEEYSYREDHIDKSLLGVPKNLRGVEISNLDDELKRLFKNGVRIIKISMGEVYQTTYPGWAGNEEEIVNFNKGTTLYQCETDRCLPTQMIRGEKVKQQYFKSGLRERVAKQLGSPYNPSMYRKMMREMGEELGKTPEEIKEDIRAYERSKGPEIVEFQIQHSKPPSKRDQGYGKIRN